MDIKNCNQCPPFWLRDLLYYGGSETPTPTASKELREDGGTELREDAGIELREN